MTGDGGVWWPWWCPVTALWRSQGSAGEDLTMGTQEESPGNFWLYKSIGNKGQGILSCYSCWSPLCPKPGRIFSLLLPTFPCDHCRVKSTDGCDPSNVAKYLKTSPKEVFVNRNLVTRHPLSISWTYTIDRTLLCPNRRCHSCPWGMPLIGSNHTGNDFRITV